MDYDPADAGSIERFGKRLIGKTIRDLKSQGVPIDSKGKSGIGHIVEAYFGIKKNNESEPDFPLAGVELKTAPLNHSAMPRYPLSLTQIDFDEVRKERWDNASFKKKVKKLLLVFYDDTVPLLDKCIKYVFLWEPNAVDWSLFRYDWEEIHDTIIANKIDELSETKTRTLIARRKGAKEQTRTAHIGSLEIDVKPRCFALKRAFMEYVLARGIAGGQSTAGSLMANLSVEEMDSFEETAVRQSRKYWGMRVKDIESMLGLSSNSHSKSYAASVVYHALGLRKNETSAEEFEKAGVRVKTVRCRPDFRPIYAMSLRSFNYEDILDETWEDSTVKDDIQKIIYVVLRQPYKNASQAVCVVERVFFESMSDEDLRIAKKDWELFVGMIRHKRAHELTGNLGRMLQTRPKAKDSSDTVSVEGRQLVKKGFFIRTEYLVKVLERHGIEVPKKNSRSKA